MTDKRTLKKNIAIWILALGIFVLAPFYAFAEHEQQCVTSTAAGVSTDTCFRKPHITIEPAGPQNVTMESTFSEPKGFSRQGIFGCSQTGSYSMSVGTLGAIGGAFVPVNDAAVTLNTGYLVFKECVLRPVINRQSESETASILKQTTEGFLTGRNGQPLFPVDLEKDKLERSDAVVERALATGRIDAVSPAFRDDVKRAIQRDYNVKTRNSNDSLKCSYAGSPAKLTAVLRGKQFNGFLDVLMLADPNCIPLYAAKNAQNLVMRDVATEQNDMLTRLGWNSGVYDVEKVNADGTRQVLTPGFLLADTIKQQLGSGFRKQESANDIDQMVGNLFSRISVSIFASFGGLQGLVQKNAGTPSYLDQVVLDSSEGLRDSAINAAIQILVAARQVGAQYLEAENGTASVLIRAIAQLRGAENTCWNIIVPKVKSYAEAGACAKNSDGGQTCSGSFALKIATSTSFSQGVIDSQIAPLATTTALKINATSQAVAAVDKLILDVTNSKAPNVQSTALQQLDALVAGKALPSQYDLKAAEQQLQDVNNSVSTLVTDTIKAWGDSPDTNIGWCNVNNENVIPMWANKWKI
ncbi:MAG: hypothetical protein AAB830_00120 [Patescibacteria group bacterium]